MSHGTHMNESWHTYKWVMSHMWMSHVADTNESCSVVYFGVEWVTLQIRMSHHMCDMTRNCIVTWISHMCATCDWVTLQIRMGHVALICLSHVTYCSGSLGEFRNHIAHMSFGIILHTCAIWYICLRSSSFGIILHIWVSESCHTHERSHVTDMNESRRRSEWVTSHKWMSHLAHMNESCHTYGCVMSQIWMSHVTHMNESCHTYVCVMSHIWMHKVALMNGSNHTYEWVISHTFDSITLRTAAEVLASFRIISQIWMSHVADMNESRCRYEWVMSQIRMSHVVDMNKSCRI